jgi:hypothetical protein
VYTNNSIVFNKYKDGVLTDAQGNHWKVKEHALENEHGDKLARIPTHNIFWFAWHNQYPDTRLIK